MTRGPFHEKHKNQLWYLTLRQFLRHKMAVFGIILMAVIVFSVAFVDRIMPYDPETPDLSNMLSPPSLAHPLGTDELGRDMLSRLIMGARLSLFMGVTPVFIALLIGGAIGVVAGYAGGLLNTLLMRTIDVFFAFPSVLLAIALSGALGAGITNGLISLTIVFVPPIARVAESVTTGIRSRDFIEAARASGANALTIIRHHVLGNVLGPILVYAMSLIAVSMILASGLSFLGLGVKPPEPEWGLMLNTLRTAIYTQPLLCALPGVMIFITSIAFNMLTDGLRSAMDLKA